MGFSADISGDAGCGKGTGRPGCLEKGDWIEGGGRGSPSQVTSQDGHVQPSGSGMPLNTGSKGGAAGCRDLVVLRFFLRHLPL